MKNVKDVVQDAIENISLRKKSKSNYNAEICSTEKEDFEAVTRNGKHLAQEGCKITSLQRNFKSNTDIPIDISEKVNCEVVTRKSKDSLVNCVLNSNMLIENNCLVATNDTEKAKYELQNFIETDEKLNCIGLTPNRKSDQWEDMIDVVNESPKQNIEIQSIESVKYPSSKISEIVNSDQKDKNFKINSSFGHITTRTRKRVRKRKLTHFTSAATDNITESFSIDSIPVKSTPNHIRFTEVHNEPRDTHNESLFMNSASHESLMSDTPMSESNDTTKKPKVIENCQDVNDTKISLNNESGVNETKSAWEILYEQFDPHKYDSLKQLPAVGDIIACKVLRMSSTYEPELSSYIFALVVEVKIADCIQNSDVKLEILVGKEFIQQPLGGKFEIPGDEEDDCGDIMISFKWHNIYDPKFILK